MRIGCVARSLLLMTTIALGARADRIETSAGVVDNITIQTIRGAEIFYQNARGGLERTAVQDVRTLGFDGLPALDAAERAWRRDEVDTATEQWIRAYTNATSEVQRLWLHARLAEAHERRGEFVQAAGHAARVMLTDASPYWAKLAPKSAVNESASQPEVLEAWWAIDRLTRRELPPELKAAAERLAAAVQPLHARVQQAQAGATWREGSTISGFSTANVRRVDWRLPGRSVTTPPARLDDNSPPPVTPPPGAREQPAPDTSPDSPTAIDRLLQEKNFAAALAACERVARDPGDRPLAPFLLQYGRALVGVNRPRDAAVRFMQCAIHFESSPQAPEALMETALLYRNTFQQPETAQRLLERAMAMAQARGLNDLYLKMRDLRGPGS